MSRTRGLPAEGPSCRGPVCASSQPHSPPAAQLPNSLCCTPSLPHPGVSRRACSGRHQHHWPGRAALKQYFRNPPRLATPRQVRGVSRWGRGQPTPGASPRPELVLGGLLFHSPASEKGREGNTCVPLLPAILISCGQQEGAPRGPARCRASFSLAGRPRAGLQCRTSSLSLARRASLSQPSRFWSVFLCFCPYVV